MKFSVASWDPRDSRHPAQRSLGYSSCLTMSTLRTYPYFVLSFISNINSTYLYILFCILGFFGAFSVALISHYQVLFDKEYMGRALSTANFFNFGGVFFIQWLTGKIIFLMGGNSSGAPIEAYRVAFLFVAILLLISLFIYLFSNEKKNSF